MFGFRVLLGRGFGVVGEEKWMLCMGCVLEG